MDIYTFIKEINERTYKFAVYAHNKVQAVSHMQEMQRLFVEQYSRLEQAKLNASLNRSPDAQAEAQTVIEEAETLVGLVFDFSSEVKHVEQEFDEYLGQRLGAPWCVLSIFDAKAKESLCHFELPSTRFVNYHEQVEQKIKEYEEISTIVIPSIEHYVTDFFKLNPRSKEFHDILKLERDRKRLIESYELTRFYWDMNDILDEETIQLYYLPRDFINECVNKVVEAIAVDPLFDQFTLSSRKRPLYVDIEQAARHQLDRRTRLTPLMYAVHRKTVVGESTHEARRYALQSSRLLLAAGADANASDCWGRTPLMYVVLGKYSLDSYTQTMPGREAVVRLLLEYGADPAARDKTGRSVIEHFIDECEPDDEGENHPAIVLLRRAKELRDLALRFANNSSEAPATHLVDNLNKADLMQFIFFLGHEFQSHPEKSQQLSFESMMFLHGKTGEIKRSDYFAGLEDATQQHFLALPFNAPYPQFLKGMHIKVKELSAPNVANALWLSGKDKAAVNSMKHSFLLWSRQRDCKVTQKELDERLSQYQM
jgi:hypothetical protein